LTWSDCPLWRSKGYQITLFCKLLDFALLQRLPMTDPRLATRTSHWSNPIINPMPHISLQGQIP
jgi:hypothetical protein